VVLVAAHIGWDDTAALASELHNFEVSGIVAACVIGENVLQNLADELKVVLPFGSSDAQMDGSWCARPHLWIEFGTSSLGFLRTVGVSTIRTTSGPASQAGSL